MGCFHSREPTSAVKTNKEEKSSNYVSEPTTMEKIKKDDVYTIILIGDQATGKSSVLQRFKNNQFEVCHKPSPIIIDCFTKKIQIEGKKISLKCYDTAGQEKFRALSQSYYRCADGIMLFYDIANQKTFDNVGRWLEEVHRLAGPNVPILIIANKCDLNEKRVVNFNNAKKFADDKNIPIIEVSAKESLGVEEAFIKLASEINKTWKPLPDNETVTIGM
ncbi:hypothetical protein ACTFIT_005535 [Dictyostelium discoideum]